MDLDGTLYDGYIWRALARHHWRHRFKPGALAVYLGLHFPLWPLRRLNLISSDFFYRAWGQNMAWLLRGVSITRARRIWVWLVENEILPNIRPEMANALKGHRAAGHKIILLSGTFQPLLEILAVRMRLDGAIATPLAVSGDTYLGRIVLPLNIGKGKLLRIKRYLLQEAPEIDLCKSFLYTDSIVDLPVLEAMGHPVVVYPDEALALVAEERSWRTIR